MKNENPTVEDFDFEKEKEKLKHLKGIDDVIFQVMALDEAFCQEMLQIILEDNKVEVIQVIPQYSIHNLHGRSVRLDALCRMRDGILCNVEIQKSNNDNHVRRVRYNASCITASATKVGSDFIDVPDVCIVYISTFDIFKRGRTIYHIDRIIRETEEFCDNGCKEVYVNTAVDDGTTIADYMQCFLQEDVNDSRFKEFSKRIKYVKGSKEGVKIVCDYVKEQLKERDIERCKNAITLGGPLEYILELFSDLDSKLIHELFAQFSPKAVK